jgi:hypothetical protein
LRELRKIPNGRDHGEERARAHLAAADRRRHAAVVAVGGRGRTDSSRCEIGVRPREPRKQRETGSPSVQGSQDGERRGAGEGGGQLVGGGSEEAATVSQDQRGGRKREALGGTARLVE